MQEIQGDVKSGKVRRTSTSGSLALRILAQQRNSDEKNEETLETMKERVAEMRQTIQELEEENTRLKEASTRRAETT